MAALPVPSTSRLSADRKLRKDEEIMGHMLEIAFLKRELNADVWIMRFLKMHWFTFQQYRMLCRQGEWNSR